MFTTHYSNPSSLVPLDVATINAATKTLDIAAYAFVAPEVIAAVFAAAGRGVVVRLYLDRTELESEARGDAMLSHSPLHSLLNVPRLTILVKASSVLMHLKSYLVDQTTLRDGSANFSDPGEEQQDNSLVLTDDPGLCEGFQGKFNAMWARTDNLSVAQAVQAHPARSQRPSHQR